MSTDVKFVLAALIKMSCCCITPKSNLEIKKLMHIWCYICCTVTWEELGTASHNTWQMNSVNTLCDVFLTLSFSFSFRFAGKLKISRWTCYRLCLCWNPFIASPRPQFTKEMNLASSSRGRESESVKRKKDGDVGLTLDTLGAHVIFSFLRCSF